MNLKRKHAFDASPQSSSSLVISKEANPAEVESTKQHQRQRRNSCASTDSAYSFDSVSSSSGATCNLDTTPTLDLKFAPLSPTKSTTVQTFADKSTAIEPELLGTCKRGTPILLEGIVWNETSKGVLVLNVNWKGRTFIGALMDSSRTGDWSAPRFNQSTCLAATHRHTASDNIEFAEYDFLVSQDPSIRTLRNGKRRYLKTQAAEAKTEASQPNKKSKKAKSRPVNRARVAKKAK